MVFTGQLLCISSSTSTSIVFAFENEQFVFSLTTLCSLTGFVCVERAVVGVDYFIVCSSACTRNLGCTVHTCWHQNHRYLTQVVERPLIVLSFLGLAVCR